MMFPSSNWHFQVQANLCFQLWDRVWSFRLTFSSFKRCFQFLNEVRVLFSINWLFRKYIFCFQYHITVSNAHFWFQSHFCIFNVFCFQFMFPNSLKRSWSRGIYHQSHVVVYGVKLRINTINLSRNPWYWQLSPHYMIQITSRHGIWQACTRLNYHTFNP